MKTRCSGYSIVELLVAIGIAAVVTGATVPAYSAFVVESRLTATAGDFHNMLFMARSEALKRGQPVLLQALSGTTSWAEGARMFVDTDGDGMQDAGEETLWLADGLKGAYSINGPFASIRYQPAGTLSVSPTIVSFSVCKTGGSGQPGRTIAVSQTGRPSVSEAVCT